MIVIEEEARIIWQLLKNLIFQGTGLGLFIFQILHHTTRILKNHDDL